MRINNCYDSHLHWQGIGSFKSRLQLQSISKLEQLKAIKIRPENYKGHWLMAHGLAADFFNQFDRSACELLSELWPQQPIYITTPDIHCVYLNQAAIDELNLVKNITEKKLNDYIEVIDGKFSGKFIDLAKDYIDAHLPKYTDEQVRQHLLIAQNIILKAGVTHIRDLTCSETQFEQALLLESKNELKIVADLFFKLNDFSKLELHIAMVLRLQKKQTKYLKIKGVKVFIDGALGSEGALLSENYLSGKNGFKLFSNQQIKKIIESCQSNDLEVAFHSIGDQSSMDVLNCLASVNKITKSIHLEHIQLLSSAAIELIEKYNVVCHMQPQHWLSDREWLAKKISPKLLQRQFRWGELSKKNIKLYFGSDAPVENMSVGQLLIALQQSQNAGIPKLSGQMQNYLSYPGPSPLSTETIVNDNFEVVEVIYK